MKKPLWIWIDPSSSCNLSCAHCYTKSSHENHYLSIDSLRTIITKLESESVDIRKLHLNWRGEPSMNPQLPELLRIANDWTGTNDKEIHLNGTLLSASLAQSIIDAGSNFKIYVSIDGGTQDSHESNRGSGTFFRTMDGLKALLCARGKMKTPRIAIYELDLNVPRSGYDLEYRSLIESVDEYRIAKPIHPRSGFEKEFGSADLPQGPCFWIGNSLAISSRGVCHICLLSDKFSGVVGNILQENINIIVDRAEKLRADLELFGRSASLHCGGCRKKEGDVFDEQLNVNKEVSALA